MDGVRGGPGFLLRRWILFSGLLLLVAMSAGLAVGTVHIPTLQLPEIVWTGLMGRVPPGEWPAAWVTIVWEMRAPRVAAAALAGAALATAGAVFQGLFRNPMADPFVIGVSSGAGLGAASALVLVRGGMLSRSIVTPFAFVGALGAVVLVYLLARAGGRLPVMTLLLAGVATSSFLTGLISLLICLSREEMRAILFWLMGGFGGVHWGQVALLTPYMLAGLSPMLLYSRQLNAVLTGEETAMYLGVEVERLKVIMLAAASLLTAASVAVCGVIGFVGLITPHIVRLLLGPDNRVLLPVTALCGATLLVAADLGARMIIAPGEMPVGVLTALLGAPFFLYLLQRHKRRMLL